MLSIPNNLEELPEMGEREVPFSRELYIEREDFMENPPKKHFRLSPGNEVRLMGAYFVTCTGFEKDENGNVTEIHCTYDPETKSWFRLYRQKGQKERSTGYPLRQPER